jgi:hypothetical protein
MSETGRIKADGFHVGYNGYTPKRHPLPSPPYGLKDPMRYVWIDGWTLGRRLAATHWEIMEAAATLIEEEKDALPTDGEALDLRSSQEGTSGS